MSTISESFHSFVGKIKLWWQEFNLQALSEKVGGSSAEAIQAAVYFGIAFVTGFLFKKYAKFLVIVLCLMAVAMTLMEYNNFISVHWDAIRSFFGIEAPFDMNMLIKNSFAWVKQHILLTVAAALGFLVGYKLA